MRRVLRLFVGLLAVVGAVWFLMQSSGAQIPPRPSFTIPSFTIPSIPPPPTMPPETTSTTGPPPTMPPETTTSLGPPPTMSPTTIGLPDVDDEIQSLIDRLERFGDTFAEVIENLRGLQDRF